jgi:hypothetical protein
MNHHGGMEMAKQLQAEYQREAGLHHQVRATKIEVPDRTTRLPRLPAFRRAARAGTGSARARREWRLSRS